MYKQPLPTWFPGKLETLAADTGSVVQFGDLSDPRQRYRAPVLGFWGCGGFCKLLCIVDFHLALAGFSCELKRQG